MNFFKTFLAALLAFIVANILLTVFAVLVLVGISTAFNDEPRQPKADSILKIDLQDGISDSPSDSPLKSIGLGGITIDRSSTILDVLKSVENAVYDDNIKGIYINITGGYSTMANIEELRGALEDFKQRSGKFVVAYCEYYSLYSYYLSSVADKVFINPEGIFMWNGISGRQFFYKGLFDKLGVKMEILRHGTFKSAVEPYMLDKMSPENRLQLETYVNSVWNTLLTDISLSRGVTAETLDRMATDLVITNPADAVEHGMFDALLYQDQVFAILNRLVKEGPDNIDTIVAEVKSDSHLAKTEDDKPAEKREKLKFATLTDYVGYVKSFDSNKSKNRIAVVYIDGQIIDGESGDGNAGSHTIAAKLAKVRNDDKVKAVVLRVNSPGGSALASEVMWREIEILRAKKPVIVSMGGMAASGGYYVSCPGDVVLADRMTLTGSIGVFGMIPYIEQALKDNLGITVDTYKTNVHADLGSPFKKMTDREREFFMTNIEQVYSTFIGHVADGRNMTTEAVDAIGQGRIWTGVNAEEIGLVDGFGSILDAIRLAADRADIVNDFRIWEVTDTPDQLTVMLRSLLSGMKVAAPEVTAIGKLAEYYDSLMKLIENDNTLALMPYDIVLE